MLRITVEEKQDSRGRRVRLVLEGKLAGPWVDELEKVWEQVRREPATTIAVDLRSVDIMSKAGEQLLRRLHEEGAELISGCPLTRSWVTDIQRTTGAVVLLALLFTGIANGQQLAIAARVKSEETASNLALNKYLVTLQERNPFTEAGPVAVEINASLPALGKQGRVLAIRQTGDSERSEYQIVKTEGDQTVKKQVIARYLAAQEQAEGLPYSSVAVMPANYRFRYLGSVEVNGTVAHGFQIVPKQKRAGLIRGEIWIDAATGVAVRQTGRFVKQPSVLIRRIQVVRDTNLRDGIPHTRVTHAWIDTRLMGRAEVTITERPLATAEPEAVSEFVSLTSMQASD